MSLELIYDRAESDILAASAIRATHQALKNWAELTDVEKAQLERGTLTYNTLNRVQSAVSALSAELTAAGYIHSVDIHADWANGDVMKLSDWAQYLANVQALRDAFYTLAETGELPAATDKLGWQGANTIEKILADIDLLIGWMKSSYRRCGTFNSGENSITLPLKGSV